MKSVLLITLGNLLLTGAYAFLTVPNNMIDGGITSTSLIIAHFLKIDITYITTAIAIFLLLFSLAVLGKHFFLKTCYSCTCYIVFFDWFHLASFPIVIPPIICIVLAGFLVGLGHYLCLSQKSSVIGYDIIALFIHKINEKWDFSVILRTIGIIVLIVGLYVFGLTAVLYGLIFIIIETEVIYFLNKNKPVYEEIYEK